MRWMKRRSGSVGTIVMDDGKANVMSLAMLNALHAAFDAAESDKAVTILKARGSVDRAVMVGDSATDIATARAADVPG